MHHIIKIVSILICLTQSICSQWHTQSIGTTELLYSTYFVNNSTGWAVGKNGTVLKTTNAGEDWDAQLIGSDIYFQSVYFINDTVGWAVGLGWSEGVGKIMKTLDGGENWTVQLSNYYFLNSVQFVNDSVGWVVGEEGLIIKTSDGGINWIIQTGGTYFHLHSVFFVDENIGWVAGDYGTILKTSNGGNIWDTQTGGINASFYSIHCLNENIAYMVGIEHSEAGGAIFKTTNGGSDWITKKIMQGLELSGGYFINADTGWVVGQYGTILNTMNGGEEWNIQNSGTTGFLRGLHFIDAYNGWIVGIDPSGYNGIILHTTNGGVTFINDEENADIIRSFELEQNFPNPFNPTTTIKYETPERSFIKITVYDVLGNEIVTLVNEEKAAGKYEVEFDASNLPSGIYYYQMNSGSYIETKKMVLLK